MTQRRGSLKAPAPSAADGAGAFRGLPLLLRALRAGPDGRARARTVQTGRAPDAGSSRGPAGRLGQLDRTADERAPRWQRAAPCPILSMRRVCCERSALSARSLASATRTWSSTGRRSRCRRTSWRRPARTSGEDRAAAGRAGPRCPEPGGEPGRACPRSPWSPPPASRPGPPHPQAGHRPARCPCRRTPCRAPRDGPLASAALEPGQCSLATPAEPGRCPPALPAPLPGARPGLRAADAPGRRPGPARDPHPHPRAGRGLAGARPAEPG